MIYKPAHLALLVGFGAMLTAPLMGVASFAQSAHVATTHKAPAAAPSSTGADARATIAQIVAAYQSLSSYSGKIAGTVKQGDDSEPGQVFGSIAYAKPNKVDAFTTMGTMKMRVVSNGVQTYLVSVGAKLYQKVDALQGAENIAHCIAMSKVSVTNLIPIMTDQPKLIANMEKGAESLAKLPDAVVDNVPVDVVVIIQPTKGGRKGKITFSAGKTDHLLRRVVIVNGATLITENYTDVKANAPFAATAFTFIPTADVKEMEPLNSTAH